MVESVELPSNGERLAEPPLIDHLQFEPSIDSYSITFVPSVSKAATEGVTVPRASPEGRYIQARLSAISELIGAAEVDRIVHSGGGDYLLHFGGAGEWRLSEAADSAQSQQVFDYTKAIADVAEAAFLVAAHRAR